MPSDRRISSTSLLTNCTSRRDQKQSDLLGVHEMSLLKLVMAASIAVGANIAVAQAADLMAPPPAMAPDTSSSIWDGFYAGVGAGYGSWHGPAASNDYEITGKLGVNKSIDSFVLGGEVYGTAYYQLTGGAVQALFGVDGRAGFAVGDNALLYGTAGFYYDGNYGPQAIYSTVGLGVEFAVADTMSIDLRYTRVTDTDTPAYYADELGATLNFHF
jgi:opacity protein-like surface antigen